MIYDVSHRTIVRYTGPVRLARFNLRLRPAPWPGQTLHDHELLIDPAPASVQQAFGSWHVTRDRLAIGEPIQRLMVESRFTVEVAEPGFLLQTVPAPSVGQIRAEALTHGGLDALAPSAYLYASSVARPSAVIADWARPMLGDEAGVVAAGRALMAAYACIGKECPGYVTSPSFKVTRENLLEGYRTSLGIEAPADVQAALNG